MRRPMVDLAIPVEDAYMVVLQTGKRSHRELWLDGEAVRRNP